MGTTYAGIKSELRGRAKRGSVVVGLGLTGRIAEEQGAHEDRRSAFDVAHGTPISGLCISNRFLVSYSCAGEVVQ